MAENLGFFWLGAVSFVFGIYWGVKIYRIVKSTSPSCLEEHSGFFRLFMKEKFDVYLL